MYFLYYTKNSCNTTQHNSLVSVSTADYRLHATPRHASDPSDGERTCTGKPFSLSSISVARRALAPISS